MHTLAICSAETCLQNWVDLAEAVFHSTKRKVLAHLHLGTISPDLEASKLKKMSTLPIQSSMHTKT